MSDIKDDIQMKSGLGIGLQNNNCFSVDRLITWGTEWLIHPGETSTLWS